MLNPTYKKLIKDFTRSIPVSQIITDDLRTLAYGTDASFYRLTPKVIVLAENEQQVSAAMMACRKHKTPFTFRAAGTSLSGQALTESVLIKLGRGWNHFSINDEGKTVVMQPGVIGGAVNRRLQVYKRKLGPDPASINSAQIGGIIANNASGMTSGTLYNSYNTLAAMRIIFSDGTVLDTNDPASRASFLIHKKALTDQLQALSAKIRADKKLAAKISRKYAIKNTCGYGLNALIDFHDPIDIITRLMVGSEGTLGFISEVTLNTVADLPYKATAFLLFKTINEACLAIPALEELKVDAAELMDFRALESVAALPGIPFNRADLTGDAAALLVEISAADPSELMFKEQKLTGKILSFHLLNRPAFTSDPQKRATIWKIRKGLFPTGCKNREDGTTIIIEDVNFPVPSLASAVADLQQLLKKYNYTDSFIWGHALSGNIHFVLTQKFDSAQKVADYDNFMQEMVKLVIGTYDGSLKAEHGTGRNMAPFVKYEWGDDAYAVMREIKNIFDRDNLVNPGVVINDDARIHLKNIKSIYPVHPSINKCTDCGFCESICPSKNLTLTPRQRITVLREKFAGKSFNARTLKKLSITDNYYLEKTCAADGMCQTECPVNINVADIIKEYRRLTRSQAANYLATRVAHNFNVVLRLLRLSLDGIDLLRTIAGNNLTVLFSKLISLLSFGIIPAWHPSFPAAAKKHLPVPKAGQNALLYFASCPGRVFGNYRGNREANPLNKTIENVLNSAGITIKPVPNNKDLCCGMAFNSKGYFNQGAYMSEKLYNALCADAHQGKGTVLFDSSPCALHMKEYIKDKKYENIIILDPVEFIYTRLKEKLPLTKSAETVAVHAVCSLKRQGAGDRLKEIAGWCAAEVISTEPVGCCGFAGDRGVRVPELNSSALAEIPPAISKQCADGYSTGLMCEMGLTRETGVPFQSIFNLLEKSLVQKTNGAAD